MTGEEKFNTCQFRSMEKILIGVKPCCRDTRKEGYMCWERYIEHLTPAKCEGCEFYLARQEYGSIIDNDTN